MNIESTNKFEKQLNLHAERVERLHKSCGNEDQTKVSLINPFIELLDYDVRDPMVVALEFPVFSRSGERLSIKADYALFCSEEDRRNDMPRILIEAKSASNDLAHAHLLRQISEYANLSTSVEFVALTNGHLWNWYRKEPTPDGRNFRLSHEPFLSHNLLEPRSRNPREFRFLKQISSKSFTLDSVQEAADEVRFSEGILKFLEEIVDSPTEDIRRSLFKQWGIRRKNQRDVELFERVWPECVETFIESQARKMQLDELLQDFGQTPRDESEELEVYTIEEITFDNPSDLSWSKVKTLVIEKKEISDLRWNKVLDVFHNHLGLTDLEVPNMSANDTRKAILALADDHNINFEITVEWLDREGALYPGEKRTFVRKAIS